MNDSQIRELIRKIVLEVIAKITGLGQHQTLALVPGYSAYIAEAGEYLAGKDAVAALFGSAEPPASADSRRIETDADKKAVMRALRDVREVVLVAPSVSLLCAAAEGSEAQFEAALFAKALLGGKQTTVLLDYQPPQFKRGTLFEKVVDAVTALRDMGTQVVYLGAKPADGYALITEREVAAAAASGQTRLQCAPGAIVTPLARDTAKEKGIAIDL